MQRQRGANTTLWVLWMTYGWFYLCRTNISAALPGIEQEFGFTKAQLGWVLAALKLAYAAGQLINGQLAERYSARVLLAIGMFTSAALNFGVNQLLDVLVGLAPAPSAAPDVDGGIDQLAFARKTLQRSVVDLSKLTEQDAACIWREAKRFNHDRSKAPS